MLRTRPADRVEVRPRGGVARALLLHRGLKTKIFLRHTSCNKGGLTVAMGEGYLV